MQREKKKGRSGRGKEIKEKEGANVTQRERGRNVAREEGRESHMTARNGTTLL